MKQMQAALVLLVVCLFVPQTSFAADAKIVTIPKGTSLMIRAVDPVSSRDPAGKLFAGKLEGDLRSGGVTVAPSGTTVYGRLESARQSGALAGRNQLELKLTEIMIDGERVPIITAPYSAKQQGAGSGGRTVRNTGVGAAVGGLADGSSGAKKGAAVGLGLSALSGGRESLSIQRGQLLNFTLDHPLTTKVSG